MTPQAQLEASRKAAEERKAARKAASGELQKQEAEAAKRRAQKKQAQLEAAAKRKQALLDAKIREDELAAARLAEAERQKVIEREEAEAAKALVCATPRNPALAVSLWRAHHPAKEMIVLAR